MAANVARPASRTGCQLIEGDARETMPAIPDVFDVVFIDAEKEDYDCYFRTALTKVEAGALVVADNVISHREELHGYSEARQADPDLSASRSRSRAVSSSLASSGASANIRVPRKGGGPVLEISSSTGSGGASS